jgi:hypothetical protein
MGIPAFGKVGIPAASNRLLPVLGMFEGPVGRCCSVVYTTVWCREVQLMLIGSMVKPTPLATTKVHASDLYYYLAQDEMALDCFWVWVCACASNYKNGDV